MKHDFRIDYAKCEMWMIRTRITFFIEDSVLLTKTMYCIKIYVVQHRLKESNEPETKNKQFSTYSFYK